MELPGEVEFPGLNKLFRIMKLTTFLILFSVVCVFANETYSQSKKLNLNMKNATVKEVLSAIEDQSDFKFMYSAKVIDVNREVKIIEENSKIEDALRSLFAGTDVNYTIKDRIIVLSSAAIINNEQLSTQQQKSISGNVTDSSGATLPGVSVVVKGTTTGIITDNDGNFALANIPENSTLQFSFVGMKTVEVKVGVQTSINVILLDETIGIEEVVAIGYGVQKKKLVTGATSQISGDEVAKMNSISVLGALQSQTPGMSITKTSGQPGSGFKVNIRGIGTTGNSTPLYIVDGVVVGNIDNINSADIESVDVLKDAASSAIYGSRASNGVVLISTKQGKKGEMSLQYDGYYGIQNLYRMPVPLNAQQYAMIMTEAAQNSGTTAFNYEKLVPDWDKIQSGAWTGTNWLDAITNNNAPIQNHSLNLTGGSDQSKYSMGLSYLDQEGTLGKPANLEYQRYTFRINTEFVIAKGKGFDILKIGENMSYSNIINSSSLNTAGYTNNIKNALGTNPFLPMYDELGNYHYAIDWYPTHANPYAQIDYLQKNYKKNAQNILGKVFVQIQPIKDLVFQSSFGINTEQSYDRSYIPVYNISPEMINPQDFVSQSQINSFRWIYDNTLSYKKKISEHSIGGMIGMSIERTGIGQRISGSNQGSVFSDFDHAYLNNVPIISPSATKLNGEPLIDGRLLSFFGRINYDYKEKYMATAVFRADGSSNFAPDKRWGYFPSISAGWVMSSESFMKSSEGWLDFLKLRVSWGQNGNSSIPPFQYLGTISYDGIAAYFPGIDKTILTQGAFQNIAPNPDIKWETSEQLDFGFDSRFLSGKLSLSVDWYNKLTKDWLVDAPILNSIGVGAPFINGGDVRNTGVEIGTGWQDKVNELTYGIQSNFSYNKNEVTRIANSEGIIHGMTRVITNATPEIYRAQVGYPIGYFLGLKTDGLFQNQSEIDAYVNSTGQKIMPNAKPGDIKFVNQDDNTTIDEKDKVMLGSPHPKFRFGLSFNIGYKGFDFLMENTGSLGASIFRTYRSIGQRDLDNYTTEILGRWTGEGTSNSIPRVMLGNYFNDTYISDRYVEKADYLRCSNMTLGYDFKRIIKKSFPIKQMRLYVSAQNLFVITNFDGIDPEVGNGSESWASGIDLANYPNPRTFMIGASFKY